MNVQGVTATGLGGAAPTAQEPPADPKGGFRVALEEEASRNSRLSHPSGNDPSLGSTTVAPHYVPGKPSSLPPRKTAAAAYTQQTTLMKDPPSTPNPSQMSDIQKYKDDQLLRNPGGDHYYLDQNKVLPDPEDQKSFLGRVGKDISDVMGNMKSFLGNFFLGSTIRYRDQNDQIKEGRQRGLLSTVGDFFKNLGSGLSFGLWHPDDEKGPQGAMERLSFFGSKLKTAFLGDVLEGIPQSINHMGKNLLLAGWNLVEVIPDATIGNFEAGKKLTTTLFDNGQVVVEYLTDIVPTGDAWLRVHAGSLKDLKPPILYNLGMPEHSTGDTRWQYIRNTPFRKSIETIGTLLADAAAIGLAGQTGFSGNQHNQKEPMLR